MRAVANCAGALGLLLLFMIVSYDGKVMRDTLIFWQNTRLLQNLRYSY